MSRWRSRLERYGRASAGASAVPLRPRADARQALGLWRAGPVAGHGLRLRRLRLRGVSRATRPRIVFARPGAIAVLRSVSVYSFAAAAPVVRRYARALRPRIAPPWSASALASQRVRPHLLDTLLRWAIGSEHLVCSRKHESERDAAEAAPDCRFSRRRLQPTGSRLAIGRALLSAHCETGCASAKIPVQPRMQGRSVAASSVRHGWFTPIAATAPSWPLRSMRGSLSQTAAEATKRTRSPIAPGSVRLPGGG